VHHRPWGHRACTLNCDDFCELPPNYDVGLTHTMINALLHRREMMRAFVIYAVTPHFKCTVKPPQPPLLPPLRSPPNPPNRCIPPLAPLLQSPGLPKARRAPPTPAAGPSPSPVHHLPSPEAPPAATDDVSSSTLYFVAIEGEHVLAAVSAPPGGADRHAIAPSEPLRPRSAVSDPTTPGSAARGFPRFPYQSSV
jgi:hypothetical protein